MPVARIVDFDDDSLIGLGVFGFLSGEPVAAASACCPLAAAVLTATLAAAAAAARETVVETVGRARVDSFMVATAGEGPLEDVSVQEAEGGTARGGFVLI